MKVRQLYFALISLNLLIIYSLDASVVVLAINSGGLAYASPLGFSYSDDDYYTPGSVAIGLSNLEIAHTDDDIVYQSVRWDSAIFGYDLPISIDGEYVLILQFSEIIFSGINIRVFTVQIGNYVVADKLDLIAIVGPNTAYDIYVPFTLSSGTVSIAGNAISGAYSSGNLQVRFYLFIQNPNISGLILIKGDCGAADYCNMCHDVRCSVCNALALTCTTCITNASIVSGVCQCNPGTYWVSLSATCVVCDNLCISCNSENFICETCSGANVLVSSVCLRACPYGFGSSCASVSTAVIDQSFADYFYGAYGLFQTGTSSSTYYFFNSPETIDPIPAKSRGLYFSGGSYLQTTSAVYISLNFSIGMWIWVLPGSGDIFTNSPGIKITISALGVMTIILESKSETTTSIATAVLNPSNSAWVYISFVISFSPSTTSTTIVPYLNNSPQTSSISNGYLYRDDTINVLTLGKSSSSNFLGFIYQFTLWNVAVSNFNTQYSDQICGTGATASCLWKCNFSQWMNGATPTNCNSCPNGCVRNVSCNVCYDPLCKICTGFLTGLCTQCVSNASGTPCVCNSGYYWDSTNEECALCDSTCKTCTSSASTDCIVCASDLAWNSSSGICESCHQWQFKANDSCHDCPPLCAQCDNENKCTWCINNAALNSGTCSCSPGWIGNTTCTYVPFNVSLSVEKNNTLILTFSDILKQDLRAEQISIKIHNQTIESWSISPISSKEYLISCNFDAGISKGTVITIYFINSTSIASISGGVIHEEYLSGTLYSSLMTAEEQEVAQIQKQVSAGTAVLVGSSIALAMFNPNPSGLWTMLNTIQLISYIPYASYPLTDKVSAFFESMGDFSLIPNLFLFFIDENQDYAPYYQAKKYGYDSSLILVNIGNDLTILVAIIAIFPIVYYFSKCSQRFIAKKFKKMSREYKFGTFIRFWILNYLEIGFASIIGVLSIENYENLKNPLILTNYILCWFFIVIVN